MGQFDSLFEYKERPVQSLKVKVEPDGKRLPDRLVSVLNLNNESTPYLQTIAMGSYQHFFKNKFHVSFMKISAYPLIDSGIEQNSWTWSLFIKGYKKDLEYDDLYKCSKYDKTEKVCHILER